MCEILCTSAVIVGRYTVKWKIHNYSYLFMAKGEALKSPVFETGKDKVRWWIELYPEGTKDATKDYISISLKKESNEGTNVRLKISLLNKLNQQMESVTAQTRLIKSWEFNNWKAKEYLFSNTSNFLDNDILRIELNLEVVEGITHSSSVNPDIITDITPLSTDYLNLLSSSAMSDFTIRVKNKVFNVHKLVLATRSPVFAAMFSHDLLENKESTVDIQDVDPDVMEAVIKYIYTGQCDTLDKMAQDLLPISDKYCLNNLKSQCEYVLSSKLNPENVTPMLLLAETFSLQQLKAKCINYIGFHGQYVLQPSEQKSLSFNSQN